MGGICWVCGLLCVIDGEIKIIEKVQGEDLCGSQKLAQIARYSGAGANIRRFFAIRADRDEVGEELEKNVGEVFW